MLFDINNIPCRRFYTTLRLVYIPLCDFSKIFAVLFCLTRMYISVSHLADIIVITHAYNAMHDDVIKWKHFPRYWPFVRGIHRSPVNSPHKGQWRGALMFSLICAQINGWVNTRGAGDLRRHRAHYDVIVMLLQIMQHRKIHKYAGYKYQFQSNILSWLHVCM